MPEPNATASSSKLPLKPSKPFISSDHRPSQHDGIFRVVIISSGSVASIKIPEIVGALVKERNIAIQVVATKSSTHFYTQDSVDEAVRASLGIGRGEKDSLGIVGNGAEVRYEDEYGVKVWKDEDEWSDWKKVGDPILHIELRRWADLVVVAPCSADMLAKIAGGICDSLATSLLRALSPSTPTILCPAMNTHMYQHPLTSDHLHIVKEKLGYLVSGPQGAGKLACGDEGPGKMTDWREIVDLIQNFASMFHLRMLNKDEESRVRSTNGQAPQMGVRGGKTVHQTGKEDAPVTLPTRPPTPPTPGHSPKSAEAKAAVVNPGITQWHSWTDGSYFDRRWWIG